MRQTLKQRLGRSTNGRPRLFKRNYIREETYYEWGDRKKEERNTVAIKNQTCNHTCEEYIRIDLLGPMPRTIFPNLIQSVSLSLWIESTLFVIQLILIQFFQPTLYKFIILGFLGLSSFILGTAMNLVLTMLLPLLKHQNK